MRAAKVGGGWSRSILGLFLAAALAGGARAGDFTFKEGLWEITVTLQMPGMSLPPQKFTHCLTHTQAVPHKPEDAEDCKFTKQEARGNRMIWALECHLEGRPAYLEGEVEYQGERLTGRVRIRDESEEMTQHLSGRWLGECR